MISILFELEWDELKSIYPKLKASNETLIEFLLDIDKKAKQSISRLGKREKEILIYAFNKTNNKDYWIKWDELKPSCDNLSSPRSKSASLSRSTKILETRELLIRDGQKRTTAIRLTALGRRAAKQFTNQTVNKTPRSRPNC
ncbi:MAG: hypothetical protein KME64_03885 [Scytonematopsis contorta HA4267-MV1]|nr:hypothetical protein [Scytonematopsis contorta HA4267-MV1]